MHYSSCLFGCPCFSGSRADNEHSQSGELAVLTLVLSPLSLLFCSIEFDRDCDYFAIAGVTKKIKVFEYGTVIQDAVDIHYPVNEMTCNSKIRYKECLKSGAGLNVLGRLCSGIVERYFFLLLCLFAAASVGAATTKTCWPAVTMRGLSFFGMGLLGRGQRSTRYTYASGCSASLFRRAIFYIFFYITFTVVLKCLAFQKLKCRH